MTPLIQETSAGLYCAAGDFHIDPIRRVPKALITHAHADHARPGSGHYLTAREGRRVLRTRLGPSAVIETLSYGQQQRINGVTVSFHPAGHILGSAQIRVEHHGEVWVVSGDYKIEPDPTCTDFEHVRCHTFITESTFGLPVYQWPEQRTIFSEINHWWQQCQRDGVAAVLLAWSLGKAQRLIAGVDPEIGPIYCHPSVELLNGDYRASGVPLPKTWLPAQAPARNDWGGVLIVAPPSVAQSAWMAGFGQVSMALASGWTLVRNTRRQGTVDRGFPLSDHVDWPGLLTAIDESGAERILVTHGFTEQVARWLRDQGRDARAIPDVSERASRRNVPGETHDTGRQRDAATVPGHSPESGLPDASPGGDAWTL